MPIDVYDKPKFIETCEIDCGSLIHDEDLSLSLFQFSLSFQLFRMMKFYSFLVVLNMVEEASKKVYVSDIVISMENIIIYRSISKDIFIRSVFNFSFKEKFLFHLYLSSIFIGIAYPLARHCVGVIFRLLVDTFRLHRK